MSFSAVSERPERRRGGDVARFFWMANSVPPARLERVILPSQAWLRRVSNTPRGRQMFDSQFAAFGRSLDHAAHPEVIAPWHIMKSLHSAVTQERMISADAP